MVTRAQIDNALATVAKNQTIDASDVELCRATLCAAFDRFTDHLSVDTHSTASGLNTVAVFRRRCALPASEAVEATWIGARLAGIAPGDKIVVDSLIGASLALAAGARPHKTAADAAAHVLSYASLKPTTLAPGARLAVIRGKSDPYADALVQNGHCIASVELENLWTIDLFEEGNGTDHEAITIAEINRTSGDLLDVIPARTDGVRRLKNATGSKARPIQHDFPIKDPLTAINDIYDTYEPEVAVVEGSRAHPAALIQSKTLAGARPVPPSYKPTLDPELIRGGAISDIQFEALVLAGEAHDKHLPYDPNINAAARLGFLIADGTGAGKTNEMVGIILDNMNKGRRRAVIVGEKDRHKDNVLKAMAMCGVPSSNLMSLRDYKPRAPLPKRDGILFLTYATLRSTEANGDFDRVKQITDWLGKDFDGVIAFDESQNMRNGMPRRTERGAISASNQARAGIELQNHLPEARVVYVSATGSTILENLAYMTRLGLWGAGTPYESVHEFMEEFEGAGLSGMEAITAHIKAAGLMVCRQLSLAEVTYEELTHVMSVKDEELFDSYTKMLMDVARVARECANKAVRKSTIKTLHYRGWRSLRAENGQGQYLGAVYGSVSKRMVDTLIVSIKTATMIHDMNKALARGEAIVIQLQNTFEAELNRAIASGAAYESDQFQATSEIVRFIQGLPDYQVDANGRALLDPNGKTIPVVENIHAKNAMLERIRALPSFMRPLEQLFAEYGADRIAELTGRTRRLVPLNPLGTQGDPEAPMTVQQRTDNDRRQDWRSFMADQKQIIVFSNDAGGTGMDYHASLSHRNQRLRRHMILQVGHRADQAVQGPGRSHRSAQKQAPVVVVVRLDLPAEKVYTSAVVARMASLGALSQGHRAASANGLFTTLDTYNSPHAIAGWERFISKLKSNQYGDLKTEDFAMLGYFDNVDQAVHTSKSEFMKRAATLPIAIQRAAFGALDAEINNHIMIQIGQGQFDTGPETLRDPVSVLSSEAIYVHPYTGARIIVSRLACDVTANIAKFHEAYQSATFMRQDDNEMPRVFFNQAMADVWIEYDAGSSSTGFPFVQVIRPDGDSLMPKISMRGKRIEEITDHSYAELLWNSQADRIAAHREKFRTIITGALPLAWTHLQKSSHSRHARRLWVAKTDRNDRLLGFISNELEVEALKIKLNQLQLAEEVDFKAILTAFHAGQTITLGNKMIITPQMVKAATQQTLNTRIDAIDGFREKARDLGLCIAQFSGLEFFTFPADPSDAGKVLKNLIAMYGYGETTDQPDWTLVS